MTRIGTIVLAIAFGMVSAVSADEMVPQSQQSEGIIPGGMTVEENAAAGDMEQQALAVMQAQEAGMQPPGTMPPVPMEPSDPPKSSPPEDSESPEPAEPPAPPPVLTEEMIEAMKEFIDKNWPGGKFVKGAALIVMKAKMEEEVKNMQKIGNVTMSVDENGQMVISITTPGIAKVDIVVTKIPGVIKPEVTEVDVNGIPIDVMKMKEAYEKLMRYYEKMKEYYGVNAP